MAADVLTRDAFERMFPGQGQHFDVLRAACAEFEIGTAERVAAFLAQLHHESAGLKRTEESFAYSAQRLMVVWPFRFRTLEHAQKWAAMGPQALANYVYANRMGNGSPITGDGWNYRGRGWIQITGKNNYAEFGRAFDAPLLSQPDFAFLPGYASRIAARYWATRGCSAKADAHDIAGITRAINGGLTGLSERTATWRQFRALLGLAA